MQRARELKDELTEFVLDAEGELATALESYSATQLSNGQHPDMNKRSLVVDRFLVEGKVGDTTPIDLFMQTHADLSEGDRQLLNQWRNSFVGLFEIRQIQTDGFEVVNWMTDKEYTIKPKDTSEAEKLARLKEREIVLAQIAPVTTRDWIFFSPWTVLGRLGKPKLAVAVGNFKHNYKDHLYSDAPDLLEEAWASVEQYHQDFIGFFGQDEVTLSGYELGKKLTEFQEAMTQKRLQAAGIDESKSLAELAEEADLSEEELEAATEAMGVEAGVAKKLMTQKGAARMMAPKVELPPALKKAEAVTVLAHPRWGQVFLPTYTQFKTLLEAPEGSSSPNAEKLVRHYLEDPEIKLFVWQRLADQYPEALETLLQTVLNRPDFTLEKDLEALLQEFNKSAKPELPEIASVPLHLHNLFQEAVLELEKDKPKKAKKKAALGFQR